MIRYEKINICMLVATVGLAIGLVISLLCNASNEVIIGLSAGLTGFLGAKTNLGSDSNDKKSTT